MSSPQYDRGFGEFEYRISHDSCMRVSVVSGMDSKHHVHMDVGVQA